MTRDRVTARLAGSLERLHAPVDVASAIARKLERFRGDFQPTRPCRSATISAPPPCWCRWSIGPKAWACC